MLRKMLRKHKQANPPDDPISGHQILDKLHDTL